MISTPPPSAAERAFARSIVPIASHEVTGNLPAYVGRRVSFICSVTAIVRADAMIAQCGRAAEPDDLYVLWPTKGLHIGTKLHVLGEMQTPSTWVDVTGHSWRTAIVKGVFVDRL